MEADIQRESENLRDRQSVNNAVIVAEFSRWWPIEEPFHTGLASPQDVNDRFQPICT